MTKLIWNIDNKEVRCFACGEKWHEGLMGYIGAVGKTLNFCPACGEMVNECLYEPESINPMRCPDCSCKPTVHHSVDWVRLENLCTIQCPMCRNHSIGRDPHSSKEAFQKASKRWNTKQYG